jgi:hypothetical protein
MGCLCIYRNKNNMNCEKIEDIHIEFTGETEHNKPNADDQKNVLVKQNNIHRGRTVFNNRNTRKGTRCSYCKRVFYTRENLFSHFWCFTKAELDEIKRERIKT